MKNLLKSALGTLVAAAAMGVLASAAMAAAPTLSPVPEKCSGCESSTNVEFSISGIGSQIMESTPGTWTYSGGSGFGGFGPGVGGEGGSVPASLNGLTLNNGHVCTNEAGQKLKAGKLEGRLAGVGGSAAVLLEPSEGTTFAKCTLLGAGSEIRGSVIGTLGPRNTPTTNFTLGYYESKGEESLTRLASGEPPHQLTWFNGGTKLEPLGWEASASLTTSEPVELRTVGDTASFVKPGHEGPRYEGGFQITTGGTMFFQSKNGLEVKCKYTTGGGKFTSATGGYAELGFSSCTGPLNSKCNTPHTSRLNAQLVYTYPAKETSEGRQTAVFLSPETGSVVTEFVCGKVTSVVYGGVLATLTPLAKSSNTFPLTLKQSKAVQEVTAFEFANGEVGSAFLETSSGGGKREESGIEVASPTIELNTGGEETIK